MKILHGKFRAAVTLCVVAGLIAACGGGQSSPRTNLVFEEQTFDFGQINMTDSVAHEFKFKNNGSAPVTLLDVQPSCHCTAPYWPKEPIKPGRTEKITVKFKQGYAGRFIKNVNVTLSDTVITLRITGEVMADPEPDTAQ
jgi:hypothetical protein